MDTIYKYEVPIQDTGRVNLHHMAEILCVQEQRGRAFIWARVNNTADISPRRYFWQYTGEDCKDLPDSSTYIGTIQWQHLVFHLFVE